MNREQRTRYYVEGEEAAAKAAHHIHAVADWCWILLSYAEVEEAVQESLAELHIEESHDGEHTLLEIKYAVEKALAMISLIHKVPLDRYCRKCPYSSRELCDPHKDRGGLG